MFECAEKINTIALLCWIARVISPGKGRPGLTSLGATQHLIPPCSSAVQIVSAALQEDADVIGLSILSGAHNHIAPRLMTLLHENGMDDVLVLVGGIIPDVDVPKLQAVGVKGVFLPGPSMQEIIQFINANVRA